MPSEAYLMCCYLFKGTVQEKHFGGVFVNTDLGRPLVLESGTGGEMRLPGNNTWGDPELHGYCLTPEGLFEGDISSDDGFNPRTKNERGRDKSWEELLSYDPTKGETDNLWERAGLVESWESPWDVYLDEDEEEDIEPESPTDLACAGWGDWVELMVKSVSGGQVRFVAEFVEEDELVNGQPSIRLFDLVSLNGGPPFLEGEVITAVIKRVHFAPSTKRTRDGRRYIFFKVGEVQFR